LRLPGGWVLSGEWRLRTSLVVLLVVATVVTFGVIAAGVLAWRVPAALAEDAARMRSEAVRLAHHLEQLLSGLEGRLGALAGLDAGLPPEQGRRLLDAVVAEGGFQAVYLLGRDGRVEHVALPPGWTNAQASLQGADLSRNPLFSAARHLDRRVWSDRYLSALTGESTVGLAIPFADHVLLGEVAPDFAQYAIGSGAEGRANPVLVVDRAGEYVAGRNLAESDRLRNWAADLRDLPDTADGGNGAVRQLGFAGVLHDTGIARSGKLDWTFMVAVPAGLANPQVRATVAIVFGGFLASMLLALVLAPLWASRMSSPLRAMIAETRALTTGKFGGTITRGPIREFNELATDMETMAQAIRERQSELRQSEGYLRQSLQTVRQLNLELEERVERRTADLAHANNELSAAMETLKMAQTELVRSEKLASLGSIVGGVAHELNTPIGNGVMAVSTLHDEVGSFRGEIAKGLRRAALDAFVDRVERGSEIALRNLKRANELIASFKQVAVDQTSVQRRRFRLGEVVDEILLTLQPTLRRTPYTVRARIPAGVEMDSYPGPLGQVLTNLLNNALTHGFEGRHHGLIEIVAEPLADDRVGLTVTDDGIGIPPALADRVFDPFVTSKLGRGGSGLGLHIVWSTVTAVLGGSISFTSEAGHGTTFRVIVPLVAPRQLPAG